MGDVLTVECSNCNRPVVRFTIAPQEPAPSGRAEAADANCAGLTKALEAALHALRSYQYGNSSTFLAQEAADLCEKALKPEDHRKNG
jgi:hypothetical protein